jgi:hypothetical protein
MNKTVVFIAFAVLAALGLIGCMFILVYRPDASATFISLLITVLGLVTSAAVTFYGLGKANEKIDQVVTQTNGINSALREQIASLTSQLVDAHAAAPAETHLEQTARHAL